MRFDCRSALFRSENTVKRKDGAGEDLKGDRRQQAESAGEGGGRKARESLMEILEGRERASEKESILDSFHKGRASCKAKLRLDLH